MFDGQTALLNTGLVGKTTPSPGRSILHSWKEISSYMGLGIRTVQRYEVQLQLPVHRPAAKTRSAVLAFCDELDAWLQNTPTRDALLPRDECWRGNGNLHTRNKSAAVVAINGERKIDNLRVRRGKRSSFENTTRTVGVVKQKA